jgi:hypothetical protein
MFTFFLLLAGLASGCLAAGTNYSLPAVYSTTGEVRSQVVRLDKLSGGQSYSLLFSLSPEAFNADARLAVSVVENTRVLLQKTLHAGDADLYVSFRTALTGRRELRIAAGAVGRSFMGERYSL